MNRLTNRLVAATAGLAACGLLITGCGSGQISQTADQESAVNGMSANVKSIALRNVHLQATQTSDFLQPGRIVPLLFVAANDSADVNDKLVGITSEFGKVALTGDTSIPAGGALVAGAGEEPPRRWGRDARDGVGDVDRRGHQRFGVQLHLRLREGREDHRRGSDRGRRAHEELTSHPDTSFSRAAVARAIASFTAQPRLRLDVHP